MKKIGLICLAVVLAVGALGVGYAAWTDTIYVDGTVNTGSVNLEVVLLSSTYVYKVDPHAIKVVHEVTDVQTGDVVHQTINGVVQDPPITHPLTGWTYIASAVATSPAEDTVTFTYWNLFPSVHFSADAILHYDGSIPVRVSEISWDITSGDEWITPLINQYPGIVGLARMFEPPAVAGGDPVLGATVIEGTQLHQDDYVWIALTIHLPQDNALMNKSGSATATFEVIQWNEYE